MLNRVIYTFFLFFGLLCSSLLAQANTNLLYGNNSNANDSDFLPVEQAFIFSGQIEHNKALIQVDVVPGHYLYKHRFTFKPADSDTALGEPVYPPGEEIFDPYYQKNLETFPGNFTIEIPITYSGSLPEIEIGFQGVQQPDFATRHTKSISR